MDGDKNLNFITLGNGICNKCEHNIMVKTSYPKCKAYPDGIPEEILDGRVNHKKTYIGDNGIIFKKIIK